MTQIPGGDTRSRATGGLTGKALGGMVWTFSGTGVQALVQLGALMVFSRLLTPAEFGLMGAATVVVAFSQIISQVGVGPAIVQRRELDLTSIRAAFTISAGLSLTLGVLVWVGAPAIAAFYRIPELEPVIRGVALLFPFDGFKTVAESLLIRELRFRLYTAVDVGSYIVGYAGVGMLLAWQGYGVWALVGASLAQVILRTLAMYSVTRHSLRPSLNLRASRELLRFGFGHSLAQLALVISQQGDNMVVGRWLGAGALGIYGRAYNLMVLPATVFGRIVNRVLFPVMAQVQDERARLAGGYERALAIVALVSLPVSATLWIVAPEFIPTLLGPQWMAVVLPFRLFTCGLFFRMSSKVSDACTKAAGAVYSRALIQGIYALMVVLAALVGQRWGIGGVAIAVSIAMGINWIMMSALAQVVTGLSWARFFRAHVPGVLFAAVIGIAVAGTVEAARSGRLGQGLVLVAAALASGAVTYIASRLWPDVLLGSHGTWAFKQASQTARGILGRLSRHRSVTAP